MDVTIENLSLSGRRIKFAVPSASLRNEESQRLRALAKTEYLPGFRKGKVPKTVLKRKYGNQIRFEALESLASQILFSNLKENEVEPIHTPILTGLDNDSREFTFYFEVNPKTIVTSLSDQKIVRPKVKVLEEELDEEVEAVKVLHQKWETVQRPAQLDDRVLAVYELFELTDNDRILVDDHSEQPTPIIMDGDIIRQEILEGCVGKSAGDTFSVESDSPNFFNSQEQVQAEDDSSKQKFLFQFKINTVEKLLPDEYHEVLYEKFDVKSVNGEEFRESVFRMLNEHLYQEIYACLLSQIQILLFRLNPFQVPTYHFVNQTIQTLLSRGLDREQIEILFKTENESQSFHEFKSRVMTEVKWSMISQKLAARMTPEELEHLDIQHFSQFWSMPESQKEFTPLGDSSFVEYDVNLPSVVNNMVADSECHEVEMSVRELQQLTEHFGHMNHSMTHHDHSTEHHDHKHSAEPEITAEAVDGFIPTEYEFMHAVFKELGVSTNG